MNNINAKKLFEKFCNDNWISQFDISGSLYYYECFNCGYLLYWTNKKLPNYCPNCGKQMNN